MALAPTSSRRLEWLRHQRDKLADEVDAITGRAADEDRDLTDAEQTTCEARRSRLGPLEDEISVEVDLAERSAKYEELTGKVGPYERSEGPHGPPEGRGALIPYETPGEYLRDFLCRSSDPAARTRFEQLHRAAPHLTTAETPGLLPTEILGPVVGTLSTTRPAFDAATSRPLPAGGTTFERPVITQHTIAGPQATQKTALPSQLLRVDPLTVTKATYGGYVNLSFQSRDWTDPAILDLLVTDLAAAYMRQTDQAFVAYFVPTITATATVTDVTKAGDWLAAIFKASSLVYAASNSMPDTVWVSPDIWAYLGAMVDTTGRPLFPQINPMNAIGVASPTTFVSTVAGIRLVVDAFFPAKTVIVGNSAYVETYEQIGGQVSATEPSVLGVNIAYYGYAAWLTVVPGAFVKLTAPIPLTTNGGTTQNVPAKSTGK